MMNNKISYERLLTIFQNYVANDYEAAESDYVVEALLEAGLEYNEFDELGFGWLLDLDQEGIPDDD